MSDETTRPSRWDASAMYVTVAIGAVGAGGALLAMFQRLGEVLPGRDVPVLVPLEGETAPLPLGPKGADVVATIEQATVIVPEPAAATQFALVAAPIVIGLALTGGIALLSLFALNIARGRAFSRGNVLIISWAAVVLAAGWLLGWLFTTMGVNGALSAVSDHDYDGTRFATDWTMIFGILALGALVAAFQIGHRLQRETEGLV
jgi:hypothetical protein